MDRCTEWRGEHAAVSDNHVNYIDRLAAYEDLGYGPEELAAFCAALSAPHGDLLDRNSVLLFLYVVRKKLSAFPPPTQSVIAQIITGIKSLPALIPTNYDKSLRDMTPDFSRHTGGDYPN